MCSARQVRLQGLVAYYTVSFSLSLKPDLIISHMFQKCNRNFVNFLTFLQFSQTEEGR